MVFILNFNKIISLITSFFSVLGLKIFTRIIIIHSNRITKFQKIFIKNVLMNITRLKNTA